MTQAPDAPNRERLERFGLMMAELKRRTARKAQEGEGGLLEFVRYFWHVLEPETPLVEGWPLVTICEHLEAVTRGEVTRLLINVPPGFMKSLLTDVFWPSWEWGPMGLPHLRYVAFSYSAMLTERDNGRFRDLIVSKEYQELWGERFKVRKVGETRITNDKHGWKLASSVGGVATGERGDRILCLRGDSMVHTEIGDLPINQVVAEERARFVLGYDHHLGFPAWQEIEAYEANPARPFVRIEFDDESEVVCTREHPVFIEGRGYTPAEEIRKGEKALYLSTMPSMRQAVPSALRHMQSRVQEEASLYGIEGGKYATVHDMLNSNLPYAGSLGSRQRRGGFLQPFLSCRGKSRRGKSGMGGRRCRAHLSAMRKGILGEAGGGQAKDLLLCAVRHFRKMGNRASRLQEAAAQALRRMRYKFEALSPGNTILFEGVCGERSFQANEWSGERSLCARGGRAKVWPGVDAEEEVGGSRTGWLRMPAMRHDRGRASGRVACPPHQLRQGRHGNGESDISVPHVPRWNARERSGSAAMGLKTVRSVARIGNEAPTFNLRVSPDHNYFANGTLVHNCDDPHSVKESESQTVREETVRWFRESMSNRLNDQDRSAIIIIMQRLHEVDVSGVILSEGFDYCHLMIPMEFEPGREPSEGNHLGWRDPRGVDVNGRDLEDDELNEADGSLAWPQRFPPHVVEKIKAEIGIYAYVGQYMQRPEPRGGGIFKRHWWQEYSPPDGKSFPQFDYVVASLDGAFTKNEQNDPSALTVWGTWSTPEKRRGIMLCHAWRKFLEMHGPKVEREPAEILRPGMNKREVARRNAMYKERASQEWGLVEWTVDSCRRFRVNVLLIENKASGKTVEQEIRVLYKNEDFMVILVDPVGDKVARALAMQHVWAQGLIYAPDRDWADMVKDEMATFPRGRFRDLTDSATQGIKHLRDIGLAQRPDELDAEEYEAAQNYRQPEPLYPA